MKCDHARITQLESRMCTPRLGSLAPGPSSTSLYSPLTSSLFPFGCSGKKDWCFEDNGLQAYPYQISCLNTPRTHSPLNSCYLTPALSTCPLPTLAAQHSLDFAHPVLCFVDCAPHLSAPPTSSLILFGHSDKEHLHLEDSGFQVHHTMPNARYSALTTQNLLGAQHFLLNTCWTTAP